MYDIIIIGGGIIGGSSLFHLMDGGYEGKILVLEKSDALAQESTSLSAGGARDIWSTTVNMKMTAYSLKHFSEFEDRFDVNIGFEQNGYLFTYYEKDWNDIVEFKPNWDRAGVNTELVTPEEIEKMIPGMRTDISHLDDEVAEMLSMEPIVGGLFGEDCAIMNTTPAAQEYFNYSKSKYPDRVDIELNKEVKKIIIEEDKVKGVEIIDGSVINSSAVILAAGPWSQEILKDSGLKGKYGLPIEPIKRMLFVVSQPRDQHYKHTPLTIIDNGVYFRPEAENLLVGCADEDQPPGFDTTPERAYYEDNVTFYLQARIEGAEYSRIQNMWGGLYAVNTKDHNALIGEHTEIKNLFVNTGFSGHGIMEAPAAGLSMAEIIMEGEVITIPEVEQLSLKRLKTGDFVKETIVI